MELVFQVGMKIVSFRINDLKIKIKSENFGNQWVDWEPGKHSVVEESNLRRGKGEKWYTDYKKAQKQAANIKTDKGLAKDLIKDLTKDGWRLVRRIE